MKRIRTLLFLLSLISLIFSSGITLGADLSLSRLRCEYLKDPLGIDQNQPRLSWVLNSDRRGDRQTAYQILVASTPDHLARDQGDLWDSGKVVSEQSTLITYQGTPLSSNMRCYWKVRAWDMDGNPTPWSGSAKWSMGLLEPTGWQAQWIGWEHSDKTVNDNDHIKHAQWIWYPEENPAVQAEPRTIYFRLRIDLPSIDEISQAKCAFSADNRFALWINGQEVGRGENYKQLYEYDVTDHLIAGQNVIAVSATNASDQPNPAGFIGYMHINDRDGKSILYSTGPDWLVTDDAEESWTSPHRDVSNWEVAKVIGDFGIGPWGKIQSGQSESVVRRLPARYLRSDFSIEKRVQRATAYVCGLGLFELYLNGQKIGDHVLAPGLTEYEKRVFYVTYDVKDQLKEGENAVGVILGNGRYYAPRINVPTLTKDFGYPRLLLQILVEYTDGSTKLITSNEEWKITTQGPILVNNEYDGEEYDARLEMPGWAEAAFDDSSWQPVERVASPQGVLRAQMIEPMRITESIQPIAITNPRPDMYIFDMGQNMVGWCRLKVDGPRGTQIKLRHAEILKEDGTLYLDNIRPAQVTDIYTLKGEGTEIFEPRFVFHGFRYVELTGYPGVPDLTTLEGQVVHDDVEKAGEFTCSNPLLNQIYKNIVWGVRGNYRSIPTDCPQRDERQGWLGDRAAESQGEAYLYDIAALYRKWLTDIVNAQKENGSIPSVAPSYWPMFPDDVTWPSCITIVPHNLYRQYGDVRMLEENYPAMKKWMEYMQQFIVNGIMPRDTYGDWCVPPESPELIHSTDPKRRTGKEVLGTTYYYNNLRLLARCASRLGNEDDARKFNKQADEMREAFNAQFFHRDTLQYDNGSQTSYVLPLAFGMVPDEYRSRVFEKLVHKIETETQGHIGTGLIGGQWLMRVLSDNGRADLAYTIASQSDYPSWGYMIEQGATTIWELWNGDTADPAMNSGNHVMLVGDLNIWFTEYLAGIQSDPDYPGFKRILMQPHPVGDLTSCSATYQSVHGEIQSHWKIAQGNFIWVVMVPANADAIVSIPIKDDSVILESGVPISEVEGIRFLRRDHDRAHYQIESGRYQFTSTGAVE